MKTEQEIKQKIENIELVIYLDECAAGVLSGDLFVCGLVIKKEDLVKLSGVNDSKKLTEKKREKLYGIIREKCKVGIGIADEKEIDKINILNATFLAMRRALGQIDNYDIVLVDGNHKIREYSGRQEEIIKGDGRSLSIAAASIVAKVYRDDIMKGLALQYPDYRFEKHKGYGTKLHRELLHTYGACNIHRKTFLRKILGE